MLQKIVLAVSRLPLAILCPISSLLYYLLYYIFKYRRKVVEENLGMAFPEWTKTERKRVEKKYYRHLADLLVEGLKNLSASVDFYKKHYELSNPELPRKLFRENQSFILVSAHYNNWEYMIRSLPIFLDHQVYGIGAKVRSDFWEEILTSSREKYGMKVIYASNLKPAFEQTGEHPSATLILADQSPGSNRNSYWTEFLGLETAISYGAEHLAIKYGLPVLYCKVEKMARGKYSLKMEQITANPLDTRYGEITEAHSQILESQIRVNPEYWLWSHRRWKHEKPQDYHTLKESFEKKFMDSQS